MQPKTSDYAKRLIRTGTVAEIEDYIGRLENIVIISAVLSKTLDNAITEAEKTRGHNAT